MRRWFVCLLLLLALPARAQEPSLTETRPIAYDSSVRGALTDAAFFEQWRFDGGEGDQIVARMQGQGGLQPLIGLLDSGGNLIAQSDPGSANGAVELSTTLPADGTYLLIATRAGNQSGTSSGSYLLVLQWVNDVPPPTPANEVTFVCGAAEATAAITVSLQDEEANAESFEFAVYGLDGFDPVLRVRDVNTGLNTCQTEGDVLGDTLTMPGEAPYTVETNAHAVRFAAANPALLGTLTLTVGSESGAVGRYLLVAWGGAIDTPDDVDTLEMRVAPRAAAPAWGYAVALDAFNSRLDPTLRFAPDGARCDDAGRRMCADVPSAAGIGAVIGGLRVIGDRFDAGLRLPRADAPPLVQVSAFNAGTSGAYAWVILGGFDAEESP